MIAYCRYTSPWGPLLIGWEDGAVVFIGSYRADVSCVPPSPLAMEVAQQLDEYIQGCRTRFDLPLRLHGTEFQIAVWNRLMQIPYGEVRTYGQIAESIGRSKAARAVGQAANRNPLWILVPCHRVLGKGGHLTGYAGGLTMKQALLKLEQFHKSTPEAP